jgi:shikimate kinase
MAEGRRHVILIGPMGVGKTTVGEHLADRLGRPFLDSDEVMEDRLGEWSSEIAAREGVEHLHALELEVFLAMISSPEPSVIASAASVVDSEAGRGASKPISPFGSALRTGSWPSDNNTVITGER